MATTQIARLVPDFVGALTFYVFLCCFFAFTHAQPTSGLKVLKQSEVGSSIQDGVGFGNIRIATSKTELLRKWGPTALNDLGGQTIYQYMLESGELILVRVRDEKVASIIFMPTPRFSFPSKLKSLKGVSIGDPLDRVKMVYGTADSSGGQDVLYIGSGIGFSHDAGRVAAIIVFEPGKPPE